MTGVVEHREAGKDASQSEMPESVGPYRISGVLGRGGMGVVYSAEHVRDHRKVALKTVRSPMPDALASIRLEISTLTRIRHPGIVEFVDQGLASSGPWYAMELLEGETLADRNRSLWRHSSPETSTPNAMVDRPAADFPGVPIRIPLDRARRAADQAAVAAGRLAEILAIYRKLCAPLAFLHGKGIVHRDLKPANVFLRAHDQPVLMDFGLTARAHGAVGREALDGAAGIRGTLSYLAPEIIEGRIPDARADLYALGCMLWESLTGWPPFEAATAADLLGMHLRASPGRPSNLVTGVPPRLDELVVRLLAKRPEDRLGHAEDVGESLAQLDPSAANESSSSPFRRAGYLFRPSLVGRDVALRDLLDCTEGLRLGKGTLALVGGESGIGKTFLVSEVAHRASMQGIRIITGECIPVATSEDGVADRAGAPLHPFRQVLQALADRCSHLGPQEAEQLLGSNLKLLAAYEPALAELRSMATAPEPASLPAEAARERLLGALKATLLAFASSQGPLVIVLDDLQWADDLSLALLRSLEEDSLSRRSLTIIGTYRIEEASADLKRLAHQPWVRNIQLGRLENADMSSMVSQMLAMSAPPDALLQFLNKHSEGIPFYVAEYLRAATAKGLLVRKAGQWNLVGDAEDGGALDRVALPQSLAGLIRLRLSRLSVPATALAEAAAVLGRDFETWSVAAIAKNEIGALEQPLAELVARQVLEGAGPGRYRFLHDKIREETYAGIDPERRRTLHLEVTRTLQSSQPARDEEEERWAEIAYHFRAADQPLSAIEYLARAGERALRVSAVGDASRHLREALDLERRLPERLGAFQRAVWERQLADALQGLGQLSESGEPLVRAAAELGWPMPVTKGGKVLRLVRELFRQVLHRMVPRAFVGRRAHRSAVLLEAGRIFDRLLQVFYYKSQNLELLLTNLLSLNLTELAVPSPELANAYASAAATGIMIPAPKLARTYFKLAFATLEKAPDPAVESHAQMLLALYHCCQGERDAGLRHIELALELAQRTGFSRRRDEVLSIRSGLELIPGRHVQAMQHIGDLESSSARRGDLHMKSWAHLQRVECDVMRGDFVQALATLREVETMLPRLGPAEVIRTSVYLAYLAIRSDDLRQARSYAERAATELAKSPPVHAAAQLAYARNAEVHLELWRRAELDDVRRARRAAEHACRVLAQAAYRFPVMAPMSYLHRSSFAWLSGKKKQAIQGWRQGLVLARTLGNGYAEARLALALVEAMSPGDAERVELKSIADQHLASLEIGELRGQPYSAE